MYSPISLPLFWENLHKKVMIVRKIAPFKNQIIAKYHPGAESSIRKKILEF